MSAQLLSLPPIDSTQIFSDGNFPEIRISSESDFPASIPIAIGPHQGVNAHHLLIGVTYTITTNTTIVDPLHIVYPPPGTSSATRINAMDSDLIYSGITPLITTTNSNEDSSIVIGSSGSFNMAIRSFNAPVLEMDPFKVIIIDDVAVIAPSILNIANGEIVRLTIKPAVLLSGSTDAIVIRNLSRECSIFGLQVESLVGGKTILKFSGDFPTVGVTGGTIINLLPGDSLLDISPVISSPIISVSNNNIIGGELFKPGTIGSITSFIDNGGGDTLVNSINTFSGGEEIYITGENDYRHVGYIVSSSPVPTGTTFELNDRTDTPVVFISDGIGTWDTGSLNEKTVGVFASNNGSFPSGKVFGDLLMQGNAIQTLFTGVGNPNPNKIQGVFSSQDNDMMTSFADGKMFFDGVRPGAAQVTASMVIFKDGGAIKDYKVKLVKNDNLSDVKLAAWDVPREFTTLVSSFTFIAEVDYEQGDFIQFWLEGVGTTDPLIAELVNVIVRRIS